MIAFSPFAVMPIVVFDSKRGLSKLADLGNIDCRFALQVCSVLAIESLHCRASNDRDNPLQV